MILTEFERKKLRQLVAVALGDDTRAIMDMKRDINSCMFEEMEKDIECWHGLLAKLAVSTQIEPVQNKMPPMLYCCHWFERDSYTGTQARRWRDFATLEDANYYACSEIRSKNILINKIGDLPWHPLNETKEIPPLIKMAEYELPPVKLDDYENPGVKHVEPGTLSSKETYFDTRAEFLPEELAALGITPDEYQASRDAKRLRCVHGLLFSEPCAACEKSVGGV